MGRREDKGEGLAALPPGHHRRLAQAESMSAVNSDRRLSDRDREIFLRMLNDESSEANAALKKAARRYRKQTG